MAEHVLRPNGGLFCARNILDIRKLLSSVALLFVLLGSPSAYALNILATNNWDYNFWTSSIEAAQSYEASYYSSHYHCTVTFSGGGSTYSASGHLRMYYGGGTCSPAGIANPGHVYEIYVCDSGYTFDNPSRACIKICPPNYKASGSSCVAGVLYYVAVPTATPPDQGPCNGSAGKQGCNQTPDPISPGTGNETFSETDYRSGDGRLVFIRSYNSADASTSSFSTGWQHNFAGRRILTLPASAPDTLIQKVSSTYTSPSSACTSGWTGLRSSVSGMTTLTSSWNGTACTLSNGTALAVYSTGQQTTYPAVSAYFAAQRPDGSTYRFYCSGYSCVGDSDSPLRFSSSASGFTLIDEDDTIETYNPSGVLQTLTERGGYGKTFTYSTRLSTVTDEFGRTLTFTYNASGQLAQLTTPDGIVQYGYDASGRLSSITYPDLSVKTYTYSTAQGLAYKLTSVIDETSNTYASITYDSRGRALTSGYAGGVWNSTVDYTNATSPKVTDAFGVQRTYSYTTINGRQKLTSISGSPCSTCGSPQATIYDTAGYYQSTTDWNGNITQYQHDPLRGLELSRTEATGTAQARTISTTWDPLFRLPLQIDEPGRRTTFTYDTNGNLLTRTVSDLVSGQSRTWTYSNYTAFGQPQTINGPRTDVADITSITYYPIVSGDVKSGQIHTITDALGHVVTFSSYDASGRPLSMTDANGLVTTLSYTLRGWLSTKQSGSELWSYDYWPTGSLKKITLPDGSFLSYTYDAAHRLTDIQDQLGNKIHYTVDAMGNRTGENVLDPTAALARTRTHVYNNLNQLWKEIGAISSETTVYTYDGNGNVKTVKDPLNRITTNQYDALNRLTKVTDALSGETQYGYDALDQLTGVSDPRSLVTGYTTNTLGDVTTLQSPDTGTSTSTYDSAGNVATRTDAKNQTTSYQYDALNRLTQITRADSSVVTYGYDQGTNGIGHLTSMSDPSGSTAWAYDLHGRVTQKTSTVGSQTLVTVYGYDTSGRLTSITQPSGNVIGYTWANGQISDITLNGNALVSGLTYQPFGGPKAWTFANGETVARSVDLDGRLTGHALGTVAYDDASRISGITLGGLSAYAGSRSYGYDDLDRLTSYSGGTSALGYGYDASGNRTSETGTTSSLSLSIDAASNRIASIGNGATSVSFAYDANGSIAQDLSNTYSYDAAGRLASANGASYAYNGQQQRARKTVSGASTLFSYDEAGHLQGEYDANGSFIQETVWLGDMPVATLRPNGTSVSVYYIHTDHLNTPRQIDDAGANPVWVWNTITFGAAQPDEDPQSSGTNFVYNLRHPGQYYDAESGLFQNWNRDYAPSTGRYLQSDPIGLSGGLNTYAYAEGNPLSLADSSGLAPSISAIKAALKEAYEKVGGKIAKEEGASTGKYGSPQRGDSKLGYRYDAEGHPNATDPNEMGPHINYWDYRGGKRGRGGISGAISVKGLQEGFVDIASFLAPLELSLLFYSSDIACGVGEQCEGFIPPSEKSPCEE